MWLYKKKFALILIRMVAFIDDVAIRFAKVIDYETG